MHVAIRAAAARPHLIASALVVVLLPVLLPRDWRLVTRLLVGWDAGIIAYIALAFTAMAGADAGRMRQRAASLDDGAFASLVLTVAAAIASVVAIGAELASLKEVAPDLKLLHTCLAGLTLIASWFFVHTVFAQHYAYQHYAETDGRYPAFRFPGGSTEPHFSDFLYVAFTIGSSAAISDVSITSHTVRPVVVAHSVLSFFFNTAVLGFAINVGAGLLS